MLYLMVSISYPNSFFFENKPTSFPQIPTLAILELLQLLLVLSILDLSVQVSLQYSSVAFQHDDLEIGLISKTA